MMRKKLGTRVSSSGVHLHFANRNATRTRNAAGRLQFANDHRTGRRLEHVCAHLQDAAVELETVLSQLPGGEQADLHEAIGSIMETLQLIASAHARLETPMAAD
ncbi:hypothetical protein [Azospirillum picis]|uniref:Uncharacterized protein n=1 Tax=Azospirillum picis TaxID=488438 RepID=A0ABU0MR03_9PROT|nr:hypothetical protein [Azospirillum picis]MBP2302324.1 hypothetical protein [Azospirillum picis]MDQ0535903.1 hypothetical protein [Azospirillum picis]